jgi:adenine C2-methylase RlmN of 23S rRNA A2503 and tRNA A37
MLNSIYGVQPEQLHNFLASDFPVYHSRQLLKWIYEKKVFDPYQITDLPANLQSYLEQAFDEKELDLDSRDENNAIGRLALHRL